jgi:hypothetical protein
VTSKSKRNGKMIKLSVYFFTEDLPDKTAWDMGTINVVSNKKRGLKSNKVFFNNLDDFMPKMNKLLEKNNIKIRKTHP